MVTSTPAGAAAVCNKFQLTDLFVHIHLCAYPIFDIDSKSIRLTEP